LILRRLRRLRPGLSHARNRGQSGDSNHRCRDEKSMRQRGAAALATTTAEKGHVTHQRRRTILSPRFRLIGGPIRPSADRKPTGLKHNIRTPRPTRSRVTRCWWQISWLTGHRLWPPSQKHQMLPVAYSAEDSPLTVAGAAAALRDRSSRAPRSLLIPCGNHHDYNGADSRNQSRNKSTASAAPAVPRAGAMESSSAAAATRS
jgi:hypothetical protein